MEVGVAAISQLRNEEGWKKGSINLLLLSTPQSVQSNIVDKQKCRSSLLQLHRSAWRLVTRFARHAGKLSVRTDALVARATVNFRHSQTASSVQARSRVTTAVNRWRCSRHRCGTRDGHGHCRRRYVTCKLVLYMCDLRGHTWSDMPIPLAITKKV